MNRILLTLFIIFFAGVVKAGDDTPVEYPLLSIEEWLEKLTNDPSPNLYKVITFRVAKDEIRQAIETSAAKSNIAFQAKDATAAKIFTDLVNTELDKLKEKYRLTYSAWVDPKLNTSSMFLVASVVAKYTDDNGEIAWRFDVVFEPHRSPKFFMNTIEQMETNDGKQ